MEIKKEKILEVKNLTVKYGLNQQPIIQNFSLGKTTFAKTLVNMLPEKAITQGYISVARLDPRKISKKESQLFRRNNFGFI